MTPKATWRRAYATWPALEKLHYVDRLVEELRGKSPIAHRRKPSALLENLTETLDAYYQRKRRYYQVTENKRSYDADLKRCFLKSQASTPAISAATFLRKNRAKILSSVCQSLESHRFLAEHLFNELVDRCSQLKLLANKTTRKQQHKFERLLTSQVFRSIRQKPARIIV